MYWRYFYFKNLELIHWITLTLIRIRKWDSSKISSMIKWGILKKFICHHLQHISFTYFLGHFMFPYVLLFNLKGAHKLSKHDSKIERVASPPSSNFLFWILVRTSGWFWIYICVIRLVHDFLQAMTSWEKWNYCPGTVLTIVR